LSSTYKILSIILLTRLTQIVEVIIGDIQCGFRCNRLTTDSVFFPRQTLKRKKWEYNEAVHQLCIDVKKVYDSVRREVFYNILEHGIPMKLVRLIKMCLTETYSRIRVGKHLPVMFRIKNGLKHEGALSPFFSTLF
jgi:hypothetical protein